MRPNDLMFPPVYLNGTLIYGFLCSVTIKTNKQKANKQTNKKPKQTLKLLPTVLCGVYANPNLYPWATVTVFSFRINYLFPFLRCDLDLGLMDGFHRLGGLLTKSPLCKATGRGNLEYNPNSTLAYSCWGQSGVCESHFSLV